MLLPKVIRLDDISYVDGAGEVLLQYLEDWLDGGPGGPPHIDHHSEPELTGLISASKKKRIQN